MFVRIFFLLLVFRERLGAWRDLYAADSPEGKGRKMKNSTYQLIEDCDATNKALYKFYAAIMIVIFILALPLNASVLHLFIFKLKFWKSNSNNIFLFNLVLADILLLFCLPIKAHNYIQGERRSQNDGVCKAMLFMLFLNRGASIAFLTVTSIDRYFNVVHPGRKNLLKALKKSPQISILIWLFLLPLTIPTMLKTFECCNSHKPSDDDTLIKVTTLVHKSGQGQVSVGGRSTGLGGGGVTSSAQVAPTHKTPEFPQSQLLLHYDAVASNVGWTAQRRGSHPEPPKAIFAPRARGVKAGEHQASKLESVSLSSA